MHLLTTWPWPLTFQPQNHIICRISKVVSYTKFEHVGIIRFSSCAENKQRDRQIDGAEQPTHVDRLCQRG